MVSIGILSIKGGVGKTTIASAMAADLANHYKKRVLLVDANFTAPNLGLHMDIVSPEKSIHQVLDRKAMIKTAIQNKFGVDVIPGDYVYRGKLNYLKLRDYIKKINDDYDFVILDSSPNMNDEVLSTILASDVLFVVTTPDYPTLYCSLKAAKFAKLRGRPVKGIILNKVRNPRYEIPLDEIEKFAEIPVIARINDDDIATKALFTRIPIPIYNKKSQFAKEINRLNSALTRTPKRRSIIQRIFSFAIPKEEVNRQMLKNKIRKRK